MGPDTIPKDDSIVDWRDIELADALLWASTHMVDSKMICRLLHIVCTYVWFEFESPVFVCFESTAKFQNVKLLVCVHFVFLLQYWARFLNTSPV